MSIKKIGLTIAAVAAIILTVSVSCFAQGPGFDDDVDDVPIDGGVSLLVAAGIAAGAKKWHDARKKKTGLNK